MNSDENVQKAIEASKEFQREHPSVPTVEVGEVGKRLDVIGTTGAKASIETTQTWGNSEYLEVLPESKPLPEPPLVRVTRELNELRAAANEISGVIGKTVDYVGENREPCTSYYPLNDFAFANAVERLRETLEKMKL